MGNKAEKSFDYWIGRINQSLVIFAGSLIVCMAFLATYGSVRRYLFNAPEPVSYELSKIFLLLSFVFAVAAVEVQDRFLRCDLILDRFPQKVRNLISNILSPILGVVFFGVIAWISFGDMLRSFQINQHSQSIWPIPLFPIKLMIPMGYGFLCLILLMRLVRGVLGLKTSPGEPPDRDDR